MVRHRVLQENRAQRSDAKQAAAALDEIAAAINEALDAPIGRGELPARLSFQFALSAMEDSKIQNLLGS